MEKYGGEGGIRTLGTGVSPYNGLANRRIRPLCHLSGVRIYSLPRLGQPFSDASVRRNRNRFDRRERSHLRGTARVVKNTRAKPSNASSLSHSDWHGSSPSRGTAPISTAFATYDDAKLFRPSGSDGSVDVEFLHPKRAQRNEKRHHNQLRNQEWRLFLRRSQGLQRRYLQE
jgi:hypothetical protein